MLEAERPQMVLSHNLTRNLRNRHPSITTVSSLPPNKQMRRTNGGPMGTDLCLPMLILYTALGEVEVEVEVGVGEGAAEALP